MQRLEWKMKMGKINCYARLLLKTNPARLTPEETGCYRVIEI